MGTEGAIVTILWVASAVLWLVTTVGRLLMKEQAGAERALILSLVSIVMLVLTNGS